MLIDSEKVKEQIKHRLQFMDELHHSYFTDGYKTALKQILEWIELYERANT